jgi:hypothetical protein
MARQHGYFILIPAFIPVDKKSLQNQIQTGTVIHEAAQTQDLAAIMALPGIRYHASKTRDGAAKELHSRWGSVEVEAAGGGEAAPSEGEQSYLDQTGELEPGTLGGAEMSGSDDPEPEADPATTTGRKSRAKAA